MAATSTAMLGQFEGAVVSSLSVPNAFNSSQAGQATNLDLLQIAVPGDTTSGIPTVVINVDYKGTVHNPASSPTTGTRLGVFMASTSTTTAKYFASAFTNPSNLDIVQVINEGGNISYWLDYLGVAHGA
jgi:hypothetical protein